MLDIVNLKKYYPVTAGLLSRHVADVKAVDDVRDIITEYRDMGMTEMADTMELIVNQFILDCVADFM